MGKRSLVQISFSLFSSWEMQVLGWGQVTVPGASTGALAVAGGAPAPQSRSPLVAAGGGF